MFVSISLHHMYNYYKTMNESLWIVLNLAMLLYDACLYTYLQRSSDGQVKSNPKFDEGFEEEDDEHSETLCGSCGGNYNADEFWIGCDICERWFHGKCVKITPAKAESIKQYKCPSCSMRRGRP